MAPGANDDPLSLWVIEALIISGWGRSDNADKTQSSKSMLLQQGVAEHPPVGKIAYIEAWC